MELVQNIWKEYLEGEDPVFPEEGVVHIGLDEYYGSGEDFRRFANEMITMVQEADVRCVFGKPEPGRQGKRW